MNTKIKNKKQKSTAIKNQNAGTYPLVNAVFSRTVTLQDLTFITPSTFLGDGSKRFALGANGFFTPDSPTPFPP
jgi:hypothetical protein